MLKQKQTWLQQLESLNSLNGYEAEIRDLKKEINEVLTKEEIMWNQRSRVEWLKNGDRKTKFFHASASQRQSKNRIEGLMDSEGEWHTEEGETKAIIVNYFKNIFHSNRPTNFDASLEVVEESITQEMNKELLKDFKPGEVRRALNQMHPTKAQGPDGMPPLFSQKYWDIVDPCILGCVLQVLNIGTMPLHANETYICLVPKTKKP